MLQKSTDPVNESAYKLVWKYRSYTFSDPSLQVHQRRGAPNLSQKKYWICKYDDGEQRG